MIGALQILERHPAEARVQCLKYGKSVDDVGSKKFPWMDMVAIFETVRPGDPLFDAASPDEAGWDQRNMLLAAAVDALNVLIWQGGKRRRGDFPRQIPRPGVTSKDEKRFGDKPIEIEDMKAHLDRKRAGLPTK